MLVDIDTNWDVKEGEPYNVGMPELVRNGFMSFTIMDFFENFVDAIKNKKENKLKFFLENPNRTYWDSRDAFVQYKDTFIIVPKLQHLHNIDKNTVLVNRVLPATQEYYQELADRHGLFIRSEPGLILNEQLTAEQYSIDKLWNKHLQGRQDLQDDVAEHVYKYYKDKEGWDKLFGLYLPSVNERNPEIRAWGLGDRDGGPYVYARGGLGGSARFFGWSAPKNLEQELNQ